MSSRCTTLNLCVDASPETSVWVDELVIAGWTGRDAAAIERHIVELESIGLARPSSVPCFYRVSANLLTTSDLIQVSGADSSGEVEFVLYGTPSGMLVGAGSDHTDRKAEAYSVTVSKQMCFKPVSRDVWRFEDVSDHWDELVLRSWAIDKGQRRLYQEGSVSAVRTPLDLLSLYRKRVDDLPAGIAMFCGTLATNDGVAAAACFEFELEDPVRARTIRHRYQVESLPVVA